MPNPSRIRGSITALITPFQGGRVDEDAYRRIIAHQIAEGTHGIVPVGTTGESPTLTMEEHKRVVRVAVEAAAGRVPVIAGTGSNSTAEAIELTMAAKEAGADAALIVAPYYNKPTQEGLFRHFSAIAEAVDIPILLYNVPGRTVADISTETMARLARLPNIAGVKDATANLARASLQRAACGPDFLLISGEDATALGFNAHGGTGCISVAANVAPRLCAQLQEATLRGQYAAALAIQDKLIALHDALFCETSPGPVKYAASLLGLCSEELRLPLAPISDASKATVRKAMQSAGLL